MENELLDLCKAVKLAAFNRESFTVAGSTFTAQEAKKIHAALLALFGDSCALELIRGKRFKACATRRNTGAKPDYPWVHTYANGAPVVFETAAEALECAKSFCDDPSHALYAPRVETI